MISVYREQAAKASPGFDDMGRHDDGLLILIDSHIYTAGYTYIHIYIEQRATDIGTVERVQMTTCPNVYCLEHAYTQM